ncbi:MAG: IS630 transposase-related protein [Cyanobacteria bacterium P01_D01_bin.128]
MPAADSLDLCQKAIAALEAGHTKATVSRLMGIGTTTLTEWHNRYRARDKTQAEISEDTIGRALKRIGFTRKKARSLRRTGARETPSRRRRVSTIRGLPTGLS